MELYRRMSSTNFEVGGAIVVAKITDEQFWEKVHKHEVVFGEGDLLKVKLAWEIQEKKHQLKQKNTIVRVIEKLERPKQLRLDDGKDDKQTKRPRPKIHDMQ
jgi:hypothetical protein